jgi:LPS-assembly protein
MTVLRVLMELADFRLSFSPRAGAFPLGLTLSISMACSALAQRQPAIPPDLQDTETALSISADSQQKEKGAYHLRGHVEVTYQTMKLTAAEADYEEASGEITARGHVVFTDAESHLAADEVHYNVRTKRGWFANGDGYLHARIHPRTRMLTTANPFYIRAARLERLDAQTYTIEHGRLSTCECEEKGWSISARSARVELDDKVVAHDAVFRLFRIPILFFPVVVNATGQRTRQTGFLLPHIGNSSQKGFIVGDGFFWAINPSMDLLLGLEDFSRRGLAGRSQFRMRPSESSELTADFFSVQDRTGQAPGESLRVLGKDRDIGGGFRGVVDVDYITSLAFRLTYSDNFTQAVTSEVHQTGFLTKDFDAYSINLYASRYQNFLSAARVPGNSVILRQTPSFSASGIDKQAGNTPFYFSFDASASGAGRTEPGLDIPQLSDRFDFHPEVTLRTKAFWGFHFTPAAGFRATHYGTSLKPDHNPLNRLLGEFSLDLRPPSLEKIFSHAAWGRRFKHVIEPDIRYRVVRAHNSDELVDIVRYDQVDILSETNEVEYSLTNSILARKDVPEGTADTPQAREVVSWRVSQKYYFDPTFGGALVPGRNFVFDSTISLTGFAFAQGRRLSPVVSVLKFAPFSSYDTEVRMDLNPNGGGVLNAGITSHVRRGPLGVALTDFFINRTAVLNTPVAPTGAPSQLPSFHFLRTVATYGDAKRKGFSGAFGIDYNFARKIANQVVSQASYNFGCFALDLEYRRFALGTLRQENVFRVALSLANVGTFGNLKPREVLY